MPKGIPLTEAEIRTRLQDLRNTTKLHAAARQRIVALEEENDDLRQENARVREENETLRTDAERLKEELAREYDANQQLRALLFKHERLRTHRPRERIERTRDSYLRPIPERITEEKELLLASCPDCGTEVSAPVVSRTRIIEDIAFHPEPVVTQWTIHRHWCISCEKLVAGRIPGVLPKTRIGPNTITFVVLAKYRWNQPYEKIVDQLFTCFGLQISEGEIAHLLETAARLVGEKWHEIVQAVKDGKTVHCDETGWWIDGKRAWAHTFATENAVLYEILPSRGKQVAENMLAGFDGARITDCLPNYRHLSGSHQICWAHLTREASENTERAPENRERIHLAEVLSAIYAELRTVTNGERWDDTTALCARRRCKRRVQRLYQRAWTDPASHRLVTRLQDFRSALFTCLTKAGIPPDNNHAERMLRKLVVQRKISGGNRSPTHAAHHARLMSVMETLRLEGGNLFTSLQTILHEGIAAERSRG